MAILIANIGTSDLAIAVDDYYVPVYFDRNEPNIDRPDPDSLEEAAWKMRTDDINQLAIQELGMQIEEGKTPPFREFTHKLLEAYQQYPDKWHHRLRPGRIWGVIVAAREKFQIETAHIFVTDQKPPHFLDSVYLFQILEQWFSREIPDLNLKKEVIPDDVPANNQDKLLNYYYDFFQSHISSDTTLLISIKGGTPQMQTALKMQAIASSVPQQLFVDPLLSIKKMLAGEYSECQLTSYWRYMRTQKYQAAKLLLEERWDFEGASQILKEWKKVLRFLGKYIEDDKLTASSEVLSRVLKTLDIAVNCFNLDIQDARNFIKDNSRLALSSQLISEVSHYDCLLNLYSQCYIYWQLNQVANFLARMSSFYEEVLYQATKQLNGEKYFQGSLNKWKLDTKVMRRDMGEDLWQKFKNLEGDFNSRMRSQNFQSGSILSLVGRPSKRNFIDVLAASRPNSQELKHWQEMRTLLESLDFWAKQRNQLIHGAEGVSKQRMQELFEKENDNNACLPHQILKVMTQILNSPLQIIKDDYRNRFIKQQNNLYIYSQVKDWVIRSLLDEGLV